MTKTYDVWLRVAVGKLATIIEVLDGEGELLNVAATAPEAPAKARRAATRKRAANGVTGIDLALSLAKGGKDISLDEFKGGFVSAGFAANSASPVISKLKASGQLVLVRDGVYKIAPRASAKAGA